MRAQSLVKRCLQGWKGECGLSSASLPGWHSGLRAGTSPTPTAPHWPSLGRLLCGSSGQLGPGAGPARSRGRKSRMGAGWGSQPHALSSPTHRPAQSWPRSLRPAPLPQAELPRRPVSRFGLKCGFSKPEARDGPGVEMGTWLRLLGSESVTPVWPQALGTVTVKWVPAQGLTSRGEHFCPRSGASCPGIHPLRVPHVLMGSERGAPIATAPPKVKGRRDDSGCEGRGEKSTDWESFRGGFAPSFEVAPAAACRGICAHSHSYIHSTHTHTDLHTQSPT